MQHCFVFRESDRNQQVVSLMQDVMGRLDYASLKKMGVVLKRAHYFITCGGKQMYHTPIEASYITRQLISVDKKDLWNTQHANESFTQMTLTDFGVC